MAGNITNTGTIMASGRTDYTYILNMNGTTQQTISGTGGVWTQIGTNPGNRYVSGLWH